MDLADVGNYTSAFYEKKVVFLRHMSIKMLFSLLIIQVSQVNEIC